MIVHLDDVDKVPLHLEDEETILHHHVNVSRHLDVIHQLRDEIAETILPLDEDVKAHLHHLPVDDLVQMMSPLLHPEDAGMTVLLDGIGMTRSQEDEQGTILRHEGDRSVNRGRGLKQCSA